MAALAIFPGIPPVAAEPARVEFRRDILPILAENCFQCHGPDSKARQAELRLDRFESATGQDGGPVAIVPGKSGESELVRRICSEDEGERMPPVDSNRALDEGDRQLLVRWIDAGALYARHWSFERPVRPPLPTVEGALRAANPIDLFILEALARAGLSPSNEAPRAKLLRRVTLDLTGLPPTDLEQAAFLADSSPDAYVMVVDRLLASGRFGERMVWDWLEAARYADTNGYQGDPTRAMWYWRDWAVKAINADMPYDQFTLEQLAGDLLDGPTQDQRVATGFHRNHMINGEGGRIAEESRVEYVFDRVETTATVWLGLTMTCCRCHDHKFDPFTQRDYYQLAAYFNSIEESGANDAGGLANPVLSLPTPEQAERLARLRAEETAAAGRVDELKKGMETRQAEWEIALRDPGAERDGDWRLLKVLETAAAQGTTLQTQGDGSLRAQGGSPATDVYTLTVEVPEGGLTALWLECLPDDSLPHRGPGRAPENGNFVLSEWTLTLAGQPIQTSFVAADFAQDGWAGESALDGKHETGWAVMPQAGVSHWLEIKVNGLGSDSASKRFETRLSFAFGGQHTLGRFRISGTSKETPARPTPDSIRQIAAIPDAERTPDQKNEIARSFRESQPEWKEAVGALDEIKRRREALERSIPRTMVMRDRDQPRETFVLSRGAYNAPLERVEHGVPADLLPLPEDAPKNRLALARWLIAPEHPLTARVTVNRLWQQFFGMGLVKSSEDFGVQGDPPSHPELLDWLAVEFVESGWDVKHLVRLIVTSAAYRQSSRASPALIERDAENRLISRGPRRRLPSWMIRDQALALSGLLAGPVGGPPVKGYQPEGVWEDATFGQIGYQQDHGEALYRRSLYTFWRRIVGPTMFFDVANRQNCTVRSSRTNSPLHALVTLNDVTFVEAARGLAQRALALAGADDEARIAWMFRQCTSRELTTGERAILQARLDHLRRHFTAEPAGAERLIRVGESAPADGQPPAESAAWTSMALLMLNLDETLTLE